MSIIVLTIEINNELNLCPYPRLKYHINYCKNYPENNLNIISQ